MLARSHANGPGSRAVIWFQGCTFNCPGCYNPETHPCSGGQLMAPDDVLSWIDKQRENIQGVSISGGEPLLQWDGLSLLLSRLRSSTELSCLLYTGYEWDELVSLGHINALKQWVDVLITGRYQKSLHLGKQLRGSANQGIQFFSDRYEQRDIERVPPAEVIISTDGTILSSGINPVVL